MWILQDIRTRARHTCTPHAHATRALLKHPLLTVSDPLRTARGSIPLCQRTMLTGASSGSAFAGSVQDPRSVAHARFTHARFTHTHTRDARTHTFSLTQRKRDIAPYSLGGPLRTARGLTGSAFADRPLPPHFWKNDPHSAPILYI